MKIFLVAGKAGSGKGEVAKYIHEYLIYKLERCVITQYSKYLKLYAQELTDWDGNENTKPRKYLQELGDQIREYDCKFLINRMIEDMNIYKNHVDNVIIDDVRMPDEIEEMKLNYDDVYAIYVENQFSASKLSIEEQAHKTETILENYRDFDYYIANDNINNLRQKVFKIMEEIK